MKHSDVKKCFLLITQNQNSYPGVVTSNHKIGFSKKMCFAFFLLLRKFSHFQWKWATKRSIGLNNTVSKYWVSKFEVWKNNDIGTSSWRAYQRKALSKKDTTKPLLSEVKRFMILVVTPLIFLFLSNLYPSIFLLQISLSFGLISFLFQVQF